MSRYYLGCVGLFSVFATTFLSASIDYNEIRTQMAVRSISEDLRAYMETHAVQAGPSAVKPAGVPYLTLPADKIAFDFEIQINHDLIALGREPRRAASDLEGGAIAQRPLAPPANPDGFYGAVAVVVPEVGASRKWQGVLSRTPSESEPCAEEAEGQCASDRWHAWEALVSELRGLGAYDRLATVNAAINRLVKYSTDREIYGQGDYWASYSESLQRGWGDCEDIAIAKMWALRAAGVPSDRMQLVVLENTATGSEHAVLLVRTDDGHYLLDNVALRVERSDKFRHYRPIFAFSQSQTWIYGLQNEPLRTAAVATGSRTSGDAL